MTITYAKDLKVDTLTSPVPGSLHHAHCSGIVAYPDGELLAVFYWALKEANKRQAIYCCRRKPGEKNWSEPEIIVDDKFRMVGNPAVWIAPDTGKTWLFFVRSWTGWATCNPRYATSDDRGHAWTSSKPLYKFISRGIKNPPILTSKGWYVLPAYIEFRDYFSLFYVSKDQGETWEERGRVKIPDGEVPDVYRQEAERRGKKPWGRLVLQPTVVELQDGSLLALMRAKRPLGVMYQSRSRDGGLTWSEATPYSLPNPGGGFHAMRLQSGNLCVIYNHAPVLPDHLYERNPLSVAVSDDDGKTWKWRRNIIEARGEHVHQRVGGYPTITQGDDGTIHATWSFAYPGEHDGERANFTDIQYTSFTEEWIREREFFDAPWEPLEADN